MSVQDKGGRAQWDAYSTTPYNGAGGSGSSSDLGRKPSTSAAPSSSRVQGGYTAPAYSTGYVPARTPSPKGQSRKSPSISPTAALATASVPTPTTSQNAPAADVSSPVTSEPIQGQIPVVTRVRALHNFEPTEPGELAFDKGDIIKVVDRGYKDWWRGQLKGRTGIFPVNYVVSPEVMSLA